MIDELECTEVCEGVRGKDNDLEEVECAIIRIGVLAMNHEEKDEIDQNPLLLKDNQIYVANTVVNTE
ncbi:MAG: acetate--CoA ligase family protein [Halobacteria archaeon]